MNRIGTAVLPDRGSTDPTGHFHLFCGSLGIPEIDLSSGLRAVFLEPRKVGLDRAPFTAGSQRVSIALER